MSATQPPFEGIGIFALKVCPFAHFLIVRHSVKSRGVGRSSAGHVIVDGPRALDGVAQSGHELYRGQFPCLNLAPLDHVHET